MMKKFWNRKAGFTLVELLVVIAIIGILAAVIIPNAFKAIEKSKVSAIVSNYKAIKTAALTYYSDTGTWPADGAGTAGFITAPAPAVTGWDGPYAESYPDTNSWGGTFEFCNGDSDYFGTTAAPERYIEMTNVPASAFTKLQTQLGSDVVVADETTATTVRVLISRD